MLLKRSYGGVSSASLIIGHLFIQVLIPSHSWARFDSDDDAMIDREERLGLETYNDQMSYRWPLALAHQWSLFDNGARVSAGSLNAVRFLYREEIKLSTPYPDHSGGVFAYSHLRTEDILEQHTERTVKATMLAATAAGQHLTWSIMGDGGAFKEYGDLGTALGFRKSRNHRLELQYWSVDHFYASKKQEADDQRNRRAWSAILDGEWMFGSRLQLGGNVFYDVPINWKRPSRGYSYDYAKRGGAVQVDWRPEQATPGAPESHLFEFSVTEKSESKDWRSYIGETTPADAYKKSMQRLVGRLDYTWRLLNGGRFADGIDREWGSAVIWRRARYAYEFPKGLDTEVDLNGLEELPESPSPDSTRRELALFHTYNYPWGGSQHHRQQWGFHANAVDIDERDGYRNLELKIQWAWEYRYSEKASAFVNTSWDVDQLTTDFPYEKNNFRPWGGGNVQFTAVF